MTPVSDLPLLSAEDVSALIGLPAQTVRKLAREQRLPAVNIGRRVLFSRARVEAAVTAAIEAGRPL